MGMLDDANENAARFLAAAREAGRPGERLPEAWRPADLDAALAIQRRVGELLGQRTGGWKCSLPSPARPILAAPILAPTIQRGPRCVVAAAGDAARVEPEVAFVMGRDLPRRDRPYADDEVVAAIAETRLVLELLGSRYADTTAPTWEEMIADCLQNQGLVIGPRVPGGLDAALESMVVVVRGPRGILLTHDGHHGDGHPLRPLCWLANFLAERDRGLTVGQVVTTGSYAGAITVPLGQPLTVAFGDLGSIAVELIAAD
ncbi:MAG: 2-keto-4-pentenoate hydratase [Betaproteobacteria bacterium]|nr:2-keto-4-pentenoate hydratase [Betaproteobacteria bacterium]